VKSCELLLREASAAKRFFGGFDSGIFSRKKMNVDRGEGKRKLK